MVFFLILNQIETLKTFYTYKTEKNYFNLLRTKIWIELTRSQKEAGVFRVVDFRQEGL